LLSVLFKLEVLCVMIDVVSHEVVLEVDGGVVVSTIGAVIRVGA
jgi:hypothetical protein